MSPAPQRQRSGHYHRNLSNYTSDNDNGGDLRFANLLLCHGLRFLSVVGRL